MTFLIIALGIFIITHLIPVMPILKNALISAFGRAGYIAVFSIFSLISLGLIIYARSEAPFTEVYTPPGWSRYFAFVLMVPSAILAIASLVPGHIRHIIHPPIFYATILWVTAHLVANGDKASILLFASLGIYACLARFIKIKQGNDGRPEAVKSHLWADSAALVGGAITYALLLYLHADIIGVEIWY